MTIAAAAVDSLSYCKRQPSQYRRALRSGRVHIRGSNFDFSFFSSFNPFTADGLEMLIMYSIQLLVNR